MLNSLIMLNWIKTYKKPVTWGWNVEKYSKVENLNKKMFFSGYQVRLVHMTTSR